MSIPTTPIRDQKTNMIDLDKVRSTLPMPELMVKLGMGDQAKPRAICSWHDDKNPFFGIFEKEGLWFFKCHAGCGQSDEVDLLQKVLAIGTKGEAIRQYANLAGIREERAATVAKRKGMTPGEFLAETATLLGATPAKTNGAEPDLPAAKIEPLNSKAITQLAKWRGYQTDFIAGLSLQGIVGMLDKHIAFPVTGGCHFRLKDGSWRYSPGAKAELFVLGEIEEGAHVHCFESQWDPLAYAESQGQLKNIIATRGASNAKLAAGKLALHIGTIYLWPQNDEPGHKWANDIRELLPESQIKYCNAPSDYKDLNKWMKAGAPDGDGFQAYLDAKEVAPNDKDLSGSGQGINPSSEQAKATSPNCWPHKCNPKREPKT